MYCLKSHCLLLEAATTFWDILILGRRRLVSPRSSARAQGYIFLSSSTGGMCPFRHISGEKTVVCKHWLRGLCKKGDQCEFLHEYDMTKMPECYFYSKFGKMWPGRFLHPETPQHQ